MKTLVRTSIVVICACLSALAGASDFRTLLRPENIAAVRFNLNPWGPHLGFETEISGEDSRVEALVALLHRAEEGGGHRCANAGAIRFRMKDGDVGVGLLPSHQAGIYELRLYDGDVYVAAYRIDRTALLDVLEEMGLPIDDPAFRE